jgi:two-component system, OmpR family, phosphate regulon sensor histidine kinase PhoR
MKNRAIYTIVFLGISVIILTFYLFYAWMIKAFDLQEKKFSQSVQVSLIEVVKKLSGKKGSGLPQYNPVKKISPDYYVVDIENYIECDILEFYLTNEFEKMAILTDFEYGIYDCSSDKMIYGNYISLRNKKSVDKPLTEFHKQDGLVYYFVLRFPQYTRYTISSIKFLTGFSLLSVLFLAFIAYTILVVLYQMRFSQMQKDFINNMAHEFKTPISSIALATERIYEDEMISKKPNLLKYIAIIREQNLRLNNLVGKVLQIAVAEKKMFELSKKRVELNNFIKSAINGSMPKMPQGAEIEFEQKNEIEIEADEVHLMNIIQTLIDNSLKYSTQNPKIKIITEIQNGKVLISVLDKGIGMEKKYHKKIFRKFFRIPTGDIHNVKGYGLGLYYAKKVCKKHGWKIKVESTPGEGTTVKIII